MTLKKTIEQLTRFSCVGGTAAIINLALVALLVENVHLSPLLANPIAFIGAFSASYTGHYHFTFKTNKPHKKTLPRFLLTSVLGLCINETFLTIGIHIWHLHYLIALLCALIIAGMCVFLLGKHWSLSHEKTPVYTLDG